MSLTVTRARVKEKCGIADTTYDSTLDNLIAEIVPTLEYVLGAEYLADTGNAPLQATLNLGAAEIVCAEFLEQLARQPGAGETIVLEGFELRPSFEAAADLRRRALARLQPFAKRDIGNAAGGVAAAGERNAEVEA